jgi:small multidrug resistance pump
MNAFVILLLAIVAEITATSSLKASEGFTKPIPSLIVVVGYVLTFYLLSLSLKEIPLGIAYAIWAGLGTVGTVAVAALVWREGLDAAQLIGTLLIVAGVVVLNFFSKAHAT